VDDASYIAFIAYRHLDPDQVWAKWLQGDLEEYRLPKHLVKPGMTDRLGRVFRDQEELSASADLSASIKSALRRSQWLIVVCSPRTPGADWINDEIQEFRATRTEPGSRILTLLVEGDPATSFPPALRPDEPALRGRQPAAADVRSSGGRTRELRRTALLKIAAEIAGVPYDALKQRDEERARRRRRQWTTGLGAAAITFLLLSLIAGFQWYQARSRERAALALNALWRNPAAAKQFAADAWCASRTDESRDAVAAVLRESNVVAVWSDPALAPVTAAGFNDDATQVIASTAAGDGWIWWRTACDATRLPNYPMLALRSTAITRHSRPATGTDRLVVSQRRVNDTLHELDVLALSSRRNRSIAAASGAGAITTVAFSPDSRYLATGSFEAEVKIWNLEAEPIQVEQRFRFPREPVTSVRFNPGESEAGMYEVVAASHDGQARVWRFGRNKTKSASLPLRASTTALFDATFNPADPNMMATAGHEGKVFLWRRENASAEWALLPQTIWVGGFEIREVSFSHDGESVVTASADNIARVWDWKRQIRDPTAKPVREFHGHRGALTAAEFSFDSKLIVTASTDGTVRVWLNTPTVSTLADRPESHACIGAATEPDPFMANRRPWADAFTTFGCFFRERN